MMTGNAARIRPDPWQVIDRDMEVSDARRNRSRRWAEHGNDPYVLGPVLQDDDAPGEWGCQRRIDSDSGSRLCFGEGYDARRRRPAARDRPRDHVARGLRESHGGA